MSRMKTLLLVSEDKTILGASPTIGLDDTIRLAVWTETDQSVLLTIQQAKELRDYINKFIVLQEDK